MQRSDSVRKPAAAGRFYPAAKSELLRELDGMLAQHAGVSPNSKKPLAIIVPHAGYMYSGYTAAAAYEAARAFSYDTIVVAGPSHFDSFQGGAIYSGSAYATPLGEAQIDWDFAQRIMSKVPDIKSSNYGHREEHSIEVQVPFIQAAFPQTPIVPIALGNQSRELSGKLADALAELRSYRDFLFVASSDLSHFHTHAAAQELDGKASECISELDSDGFLEFLTLRKTEACGFGAVLTAMQYGRALGAKRADVLHQCTSGDVTGDTSRVVGYLSAAIRGDND